MQYNFPFYTSHTLEVLVPLLYKFITTCPLLPLILKQFLSYDEDVHERDLSTVRVDL